MTDGDDQRSLPLRLKAAFQAELPIPAGIERHLGEALAETLGRTGNLVRAELAYSMACAFGVGEAEGIQLATAMEYFHTASLLFDDLPSMDNATYRRGALCLHHRFGEGSTILAALALINRAYALLWKALASAAHANAAAALSYVERYLGLHGLLNGQSEDIHYAQLSPAGRSPGRVAMGKTVSLIRLSLVLPALAGGGEAHTVRLLNRLSVLWGLAYQGLDDLKDVLHEARRAGKSTGRDALLHRPNLAIALGTPAAITRLHRLVTIGTRLVAQLQTRESSLLCLDAPSRRLEREVAALATDLADLDKIGGTALAAHTDAALGAAR